MTLNAKLVTSGDTARLLASAFVVPDRGFRKRQDQPYQVILRFPSGPPTAGSIAILRTPTVAAVPN
jgi:hypothetical protein